MIDYFIFSNLDIFDEQFQLLMTPMENVEASFNNYTDTVLSKAKRLVDAIDFSKSLNNVLEEYTSTSV